MFNPREIIAEAGVEDTLLARNRVRTVYYVKFVSVYPRALIKHLLGK